MKIFLWNSFIAQFHLERIILKYSPKRLLRTETIVKESQCKRSSSSVKEGKSYIMRVLNVAEKNDAAKSIAGFLSRGTFKRRDGFSVYNKIYEFNGHVQGQSCHMIMTSVSGHLLNFKFVGTYSSWQSCHPLSLFEAPVIKDCIDETMVKIKKTLENEVRNCDTLIIWTDCDREGENIGYEIIQVCQGIKPNISVYRAKFSEITQASIDRAICNLEAPKKLLSDAVDVRSELDLRIGAAFTRFQTLRLQKVFPRSLADMLISYGSCQFPTLGFVVERFLAIENFKPELYWKIDVTDIRGDIHVNFRWHRVRLFEKLPCQVFHDMCLEQPDAKVVNVTRKPQSKWRPLPLDTIELEKQSSRKLRLNAKHTMKIAEKLYTQGLISYPRTETNIYPKELNLLPIVTQQTNSAAWGDFAQRILNDGITPRQGRKNDQAHPPIHPIKYVGDLQGEEARVYEYIVRHFLASLAKNAEGQETVVDIEIAGEKFTATGLRIIEKNYLDVYIYEKWSNKEIYAYQVGDTFKPSSIDMTEEKTRAPNLLTEADLIALMDKHGIGTDATHAEHIDTIKSRQYVGLINEKYFIPGKLGIGLVTGYDEMGYAMSKPNLRADLEKDLKSICDGMREPHMVLQEQIKNYRDMFKIAIDRANLIDQALARYLDERPLQVENVAQSFPTETFVSKCPKCNSNMTLKDRKRTEGKFISCVAYPDCKNAIWFPQTVENVSVLSETCNRCPGNMPKLEFKLKRNVFPSLGNSYVTCIGGCDTEFNEMLNIRQENIRRTGSYESGYGTSTSRTVGFASESPSHRASRESPVSTASASSTNERNMRNWQGIGEVGAHTINEERTARSVTSREGSTRQSSSNRGSCWGQMGEGEFIVCNCGNPASELTVKKAGPNQGRPFFRCAKSQAAGACDFFLWSTDDGDSQHLAEHRQPNSSFVNNTEHSSSSVIVHCRCNEPARKLLVKKDGPNKGREFYACVNGRSAGDCNFFQWANESTTSAERTFQQEGTGSHGRGRGRGRGRGHDSGRSRSYNGAGADGHNVGRGRKRGGDTSTGNASLPSNRKCGKCGVEGHTRRTCPQNAMD